MEKINKIRHILKCGPGSQDQKFRDPQPKIKNLEPLDRFRLPNTYFDMLLRRGNGSV